MPEEKHVNTEGWHVVLAVIVLLAVVGFLYYQAKKDSSPQPGVKKDPLEFFGVPHGSRDPILPVAGTPTPTPVKVR